MGTIKNFEDLEIWKKARIFSQLIFKYCVLNEKFQQHEKAQIDRASSSVMDNIAEGFEREGNKEFINFLTIAKGSAAEVRSQLIRAKDKNYLDDETFIKLKNESIEISKSLSGFVNYLKKSNIKGNKFNQI
ncbi:MAG: four helix bundle protein [Flavobacteriaceae bacterium]|nr:four helix bundle protein [Flavobacteriaceae bacterium]